VDLSKEFVGVERLREIKEKGPRRKMVGLELEGKRIARQGVKMVKDGKEVGEVTSGTFGPTVQKSIAMGFVDAELSSEGTELAVDLKGTLNAARVVKLPFYKKA
jgi:aminomethyltransferase